MLLRKKCDENAPSAFTAEMEREGVHAGVGDSIFTLTFSTRTLTTAGDSPGVPDDLAHLLNAARAALITSFSTCAWAGAGRSRFAEGQLTRNSGEMTGFFGSADAEMEVAAGRVSAASSPIISSLAVSTDVIATSCFSFSDSKEEPLDAVRSLLRVLLCARSVAAS
jgi:hypothetical protein